VCRFARHVDDDGLVGVLVGGLDAVLGVLVGDGDGGLDAVLGVLGLGVRDGIPVGV
jgi:hypothetical protein